MALWLSSSSDIMSPLSSVIMSPISPMSPMSPIYPVTPIITSKNIMSSIYPIYANAIVDEDHNDNYFTQRQMTKYFLYRILDKWLYRDDMSGLLKFLKVTDGKTVIFVKSDEELKNNDISKDTDKDVESKVDFIEKSFLSIDEMRKILIKIMEELGYRWYNLTSYEKIIIGAVTRYLKNEMNKKISK